MGLSMTDSSIPSQDEDHAVQTRSGAMPSILYRSQQNSPASAFESQSYYDTLDRIPDDAKPDDLCWAFAEALGERMAEEAHARNRAIDKLRTEVHELRGKIDMLVTLFSDRTNKVIDLPRWSKRDAS